MRLPEPQSQILQEILRAIFLSPKSQQTILSMEKVPVGYTNGTSFVWNTRGQIIAAAAVLPALGLIAVVLRFWSRLHRRTGFGADDVLIVPALVCSIFATSKPNRGDGTYAHFLQSRFALSSWVSPYSWVSLHSPTHLIC